jgi:hypothetical protein
MASKVLLKKSSVAGKVPIGSDLSYGELALNYKDGTLYYKDDLDNIDALVAKTLIYNKVTSSLTTTSLTAIDSWDITEYRACKYIVTINQGSNHQVSEMLVIHDGSTTFNTEYGMIYTSGTPIAALSTDVNGGTVRLLVTMVNNSAATINIKRTLTEV